MQLSLHSFAIILHNLISFMAKFLIIDVFVSLIVYVNMICFYRLSTHNTVIVINCVPLMLFVAARLSLNHWSVSYLHIISLFMF